MLCCRPGSPSPHESLFWRRNMRSIFRGWAYCAVLLVIVSGAALQAQTVHGSIAGVVTDSSGAALPNAKVSLLNNRTGAAYSGTTTSVGVYRFEDVALGEYTITVGADGFKTSITQNVLVQIGTVAAVDVSLQPGAVAEQVTVTSEGT